MSAPRHTYRYPDDRYAIARARAKAEGKTVSQVITDRLDEYTDGWPFTWDKPATVVTKVEHHPPLEVQHRMFGDAIDQMVATGQASAEEATLLRQPYEPPTGPLEVNDLVKATLAAAELACTALIGPEAKPCPCGGFVNQKVSPNRCGQCGHLKGLHQ